MNNYSASKKIIITAGILICSHSLMSCFNPILDKQAVVHPIEAKLVGKAIILKPGQEVRFYQESGILKATIHEKCGSLSRNLTLPVYV